MFFSTQVVFLRGKRLRCGPPAISGHGLSISMPVSGWHIFSFISPVSSAIVESRTGPNGCISSVTYCLIFFGPFASHGPKGPCPFETMTNNGPNQENSKVKRSALGNQVMLYNEGLISIGSSQTSRGTHKLSRVWQVAPCSVNVSTKHQQFTLSIAAGHSLH